MVFAARGSYSRSFSAQRPEGLLSALIRPWHRQHGSREAEVRRPGALPLGSKGATDVTYEGRHLIIDEVVEQMRVSLPLFQSGLTAISFYVRELEAACKVQSTHAILAPLLQEFLSSMLFGEKVDLVDKRLGRLDIFQGTALNHALCPKSCSSPG